MTTHLNSELSAHRSSLVVRGNQPRPLRPATTLTRSGSKGCLSLYLSSGVRVSWSHRTYLASAVRMSRQYHWARCQPHVRRDHAGSDDIDQRVPLARTGLKGPHPQCDEHLGEGPSQWGRPSPKQVTRRTDPEFVGWWRAWKRRQTTAEACLSSQPREELSTAAKHVLLSRDPRLAHEWLERGGSGRLDPSRTPRVLARTTSIPDRPVEALPSPRSFIPGKHRITGVRHLPGSVGTLHACGDGGCCVEARNCRK